MDNVEIKVLVLLSGGIDSTTAMRLAVEEYGAENVNSLSFDYGQKQRYELICALRSSKKLGVAHQIIDIPFLNLLSKGFSANVDPDIEMPTIKDILGSPQPLTYVPNRNMILISIAAAFAEVNKCNKIITGLQVHDEYGYHDTTQKFVDSLNSTLIQNRTSTIEIIAPFVAMSKTQELEKLVELDDNLDLLEHTITCYNPKVEPEIVGALFEPYFSISCGKCPSCSERIQAFMNMKLKDPIKYDITIPWVEE